MRADVCMRTPDSLDLSTRALDSGWFTVTIRQAVCRICASSRMSHLCLGDNSVVKRSLNDNNAFADV